MTDFKKIIIFTILVIYTIFEIGPFVWITFMSFKTTEEFYESPYSLPLHPHFEKYPVVWIDYNYSTYFLNSAIIVGGAVLIILVLGSMAAYFFAKFSFRFSEMIFQIIFLSIMFPPQVRLISLYQMLVEYHLINTRIGLMLVYASTQLPFSIYVLRTFFESIPRDLLDAAKIDGCSEWKAFWRIMFPVARPGLTAITILNFVMLWNEFLFAVTFISSDSKRTLPLGVMRFLGEHYEDVCMVATGVMIAVIPILIFYIIFSEKFIEGMTVGSIKG